MQTRADPLRNWVDLELRKTTYRSENIMDIELSFNASGWLYVFQMGVIHYLQENIDLSNVKLVGTSAGAAAAAAICCDFPANNAAEEMCQQEVVARRDFKSMVPLMKEGLDRLTPFDAAEKCNDRLGIVCTEWVSVFPPAFKTVEISSFSSRRDVVEALSATAHVPILGGYGPHIYRSRWLYDGLFTDTHPRSQAADVFKISWTPDCSCGCTAGSNPRLICPGVLMPLRWCMLPPDDRTLRLIFYHGYTQVNIIDVVSDHSHMIIL